MLVTLAAFGASILLKPTRWPPGCGQIVNEVLSCASSILNPCWATLASPFCAEPKQKYIEDNRIARVYFCGTSCAQFSRLIHRSEVFEAETPDTCIRPFGEI